MADEIKIKEPEEEKTKDDAVVFTNPLASQKPPIKKVNVRLAIFAVVSVLIVILIFIAILTYKPVIRASITPSNSIIRIDGKTINLPIKTTTGKHILVVSKEGFIAKEINYNLKPWQKVTESIELVPIGQPKPITEQNVFSLALDSVENRYFYLGNDSQTVYMVRQSDGTADTKTLEERPITPNLSKIKQVIFSSNFAMAILKFDNTETGLYDFKQYDLLHQEYTPWGNNIGDIKWNSDATKLVYYKTTEEGDSALFTTDSKRSSETRLFDLRGENITDPKLFWSADNSKIIIIGKNNLYILSYNNKILSRVVEGKVSSAIFLPDSSSILFTQDNSLKKIKIGLVTAFENTADNNDIGRVKTIGEVIDYQLPIEAEKVAVIPGSNAIYYASDAKINFLDLNTADSQAIYTEKNNLPILDIGIDNSGKNLLYLTENNKIFQIKIK